MGASGGSGSRVLAIRNQFRDIGDCMSRRVRNELRLVVESH